MHRVFADDKGTMMRATQLCFERVQVAMCIHCNLHSRESKCLFESN